MAGKDPIALPFLALRWRVPVDTLIPFVEQGYIRAAQDGPVTAQSLVLPPLPEVENWLCSMLSPLSTRLLIPLKELASAMALPPSRLRTLCKKYHIDIYKDRIFDEMLTARDFHNLRIKFNDDQEIGRMDRQSLLTILMRLKTPGNNKTICFPRRFKKRVEDEIQRIAAMPEPRRMIRAAEFWNNYTDAAKVAASLPASKPGWEGGQALSVVEGKMYGLERMMAGTREWGDTKNTFYMPGVGAVRRKGRSLHMLGVVEKRREAKRAWKRSIAEQAGEPSSAS